MQVGVREVCTRMAAAALLLGLAVADVFEEGHQKLLEHCAAEPSCCAPRRIVAYSLHAYDADDSACMWVWACLLSW